MSRADLRIPRCPACGKLWSHDCTTCHTAMAQPAEPTPDPERLMWWALLRCAELFVVAVIVVALCIFALVQQ